MAFRDIEVPEGYGTIEEKIKYAHSIAVADWNPTRIRIGEITIMIHPQRNWSWAVDNYYSALDNGKTEVYNAPMFDF